MRIKITTTTIYFQKKVHVKINPIHNIFKYKFVYYKGIYFDRIDNIGFS